MTLKNNIKRFAKLILTKRPIHMTANIVQLTPSELLKGRWALITGGSSGIGFAIAKAMLNAGASVIITGRNETKLKNAYDTLLGSVEDKKRIVYEVMNNTDIDLYPSHLQSIKKKMREGEISILVNNAGILGGQFGTASHEDFDNIINTNLKGTFFLSQMIGHNMKDNHIKGNILNIGSSSSNRPAASAYTISKWGIRGLTLGMAKALIPHGIVVNAIAPGPTATPMLLSDDKQGIAHPNNPLGRFATPEEVANMAVLLTSGMGRTIVGDMIFMTGGAGILTFDDMNYSFE